jgi:ectoine hydroxylase
MTITEHAIEDRYPTRVSGEPHLLERTDATVWCADAEGPLDPAELAAYDAKGFSIVHGLLSPAEVQAYWAELHRLSARPELREDERVSRDPGTGEVRSVFAVHRISSLIGELVQDPRLLDRARQILGSEVYVHQSRVNLLPGFSGDGFFWRSDFEEWHAEDGMDAPRAVGISISLTDSYAHNGAVLMMPGSHRTYVSRAAGAPASLADVTKLAAEHGIEQFTGNAGAALVFDSNALHAAGNNITPYPRSNIFIAYNSVENPLTEPFAASTRRPEHLASRTPTPITR